MSIKEKQKAKQKEKQEKYLVNIIEGDEVTTLTATKEEVEKLKKEHKNIIVSEVGENEYNN